LLCQEPEPDTDFRLQIEETDFTDTRYETDLTTTLYAALGWRDDGVGVDGQEYTMGEYFAFFPTYERAFLFCSEIHEHLYEEAYTRAAKLPRDYMDDGVWGLTRPDVVPTELRIVRTVCDANHVIMVRDAAHMGIGDLPQYFMIQYDRRWHSDIINAPPGWRANDCQFMNYCVNFGIDMRNWHEILEAFDASSYLYEVD